MPLEILALPHLLSFRIIIKRKLISPVFLNVVNSNTLSFNMSKTFCFLPVKVLGIITVRNVRVVLNVIQEGWK